MVKNVLDGAGNMREPLKDGYRYPCTIDILRLLKAELKSDMISNSKKIMIFSVATIAFFGGCRVNELVSKEKKAYDPYYTLLKRDISISDSILEGERVKMLSIKIKNSKTCKTPEIIDVFENKTAVCPVKAFIKLSKCHRHLPSDYPIFSDDKGELLTLRELNFHLNRLINSKLTGCKGRISGHSFRSGLVSIFSSLGHSEAELKCFGRWSSRAYLLYTKAARTQRAQMSKVARQVVSS